MKLSTASQAGSFESSDIIVLIQPLPEQSGRKIELESTVMYQYGDSIKALIDEMLDFYQISDIHLLAKDKGAIEPVIRARIETAIRRSQNLK